MGDAGIVDEDGDGAEGPFHRIVGAVDRGAVENIGGDRDSAATRSFDPRLHVGKPPLASRHEPDSGAVCRQHLGKPQAEPARRAGHERDPAAKVEQSRCLHARRPVNCTPSFLRIP
jgi:hypothetical protein